MGWMDKRILGALAVSTVGVAIGAGLATRCVAGTVPMPQAQAASQNGVVRSIGSIKAISGADITLTADAGGDVAVQVQPAARLVRIEPGQKDLKNAVPIELKDLQTGDRILVAGKRADDGKSILATSVVAMKHSDVQATQQQEQDAWLHGVGGLVSAVDAASGTVTIKAASLGGTKDIVIRTTKQTDFRRYAPDSVKFDDAKTSSLDQIKPGDQVRARGARSADGNELAADAIVSGSFRNIAGTIISIDASTNAVRVMDLIAKKPVLVKFTGQTQLRKMPVQMAQFIAVRLKGTPEGGPAGAPGEGAGPTGGAARAGRARGQGQRGEAPGAGGGARTGGAQDLQQILTRVPPATLADFQKGDAVMIVSTEGAVPEEVTAITLLGGVEPILQATPKGGQPMSLSPWSLGSGDAGAAAGDTGGGTNR